MKTIPIHPFTLFILDSSKVVSWIAMSLPSPRRGAMLVDILIGVAVFSIFVMGVVGVLIYGQFSTLSSGDRVRGNFLTERALEAVKAIRDNDFTALQPGTYGVYTDSSSQWTLSGTVVPTSDGFTTTVNIAEVSDDLVEVRAATDWNFGERRTGSASVVMQLSNWRDTHVLGDWSTVSLEGAYIDEDTPLFNSAATGSGYAFVTSETSAGGFGLYVFDIRNLSNPVRVASAFNLGNPGYDIIVHDNTLFVVTGHFAQEIQMYDISNPDTLQSSDLLASINVPADGKARTMELFGSTLFVASSEDSGESEIFTYDVTDLGSIAQLDDFNNPGASFTDMALHNGYAYLSSTMDTMELRVIDVFDPANLQAAPGEGENLTDTPDATGVTAVGDYVIISRTEGAAIEEVFLYDISESAVPSGNPFTYEEGNRVSAIVSDPTGSYAFISTEDDFAEFVVLDIAEFAGGNNPRVETYNTETGFGRGVYYDSALDSAFLLTNTAFIVLSPG